LTEPALLINDLEAIARAVPILRPSDAQTINVGEAVRRGAIAVIAPGTGLGVSFLTWDGNRYLAHSSEGGHSDFAPTDERQMRLLQYMFKLFDHVSFEHVCSGIGIPHLYRFLRDVEHVPEKPDIARLVDGAPDPTVVIMSHAFADSNPSRLCAATIELFASILAAEAGNLAVKCLATCVHRWRSCRARVTRDQGTYLHSTLPTQGPFCRTDGPHPDPSCHRIGGRSRLWIGELAHGSADRLIRMDPQPNRLCAVADSEGAL
jgi:hypothetical protein